MKSPATYRFEVPTQILCERKRRCRRGMPESFLFEIDPQHLRANQGQGKDQISRPKEGLRVPCTSGVGLAECGGAWRMALM